MTNDSLKIITKGAGIIFIYMIISKLLNYGYRALVARGLGPEYYGTLNLGLAILGILSIIGIFGLNQGVERYIGYYQNDKKRIKGVIISSIKISFIISIILSIALIFTAGIISNKIFQSSDLKVVLIIFAITLPFYVFFEILLATFRGLKKVEYYGGLKNLIEPTIRIIFTAVLLYMGYSLLGSVLGYTFSMIITAVLGFWLLEKKTFSLIKNRSFKMTKELINFSWPLIFTGFLFLLMGWIDTLMLGYFKSEYLVGLYNAALPTAALIVITQASFDALFITELSGLYAKKKLEEIKEAYHKVTKWIFIFALPILLFTVSYSKEILQFLFGNEYIIASKALIILSIGYFIGVLVGPAENLFNITGNTKTKLKIRVAATATNIICGLLLIPKFGIEGAALATAISIIELNILNIIIAKRYINIQPYNRKYLKPLIAGLISLVSIYYLNYNIIFLGIIFVILYSILLIVFKGVDNEEKELLKRVLKR